MENIITLSEIEDHLQGGEFNIVTQPCGTVDDSGNQIVRCFIERAVYAQNKYFMNKTDKVYELVVELYGVRIRLPDGKYQVELMKHGKPTAASEEDQRRMWIESLPIDQQESMIISKAKAASLKALLI